MIKRFLKHVTRPEIYHGEHKKPSYFEGWYFKMVGPDQQSSWAIIPGIFIGQTSEQTHAFIQVLNGQTHDVAYHRFPIDQFSFDRDRFNVQIQDNKFSGNSLTVTLDNCQANLEFRLPVGWPVTLRSPGIMGWYAWVPFMECYHGVVSLNHQVTGTITLGKNQHALDGGRGYIEKDWGRNFPQTWVWTQGNNFKQDGTSLTASVARIPWLGRTFTGFIIGLLHDNQLHRFATYNGSKLTHLAMTENDVQIATKNKTHFLEIKASRNKFANLKAPTPNGMTNIVRESLDAIVWVKLTTISGEIVFEGESVRAGLEIEGDYSLLGP